MTRDAAETIALQALGWLVGNEDLLPVFLGATGASSDSLREGAANPEFLDAVLGFLTMDDAWVTAFCEAHALDYGAPLAARRALSGRAEMHWT